MRYLLKHLQVVFPGHPMDGKRVDIRYQEGRILEIGADLSFEKDEILKDYAGCHVSPSWFDIGPICGEPGNESRETWDSLFKASINGGFCDLAPSPATSPSISDSTTVKYLNNISNSYGVKLWPLATLSQQRKGGDMAEMYDMHDAGAVAFTDGLKSIQHPGLLLRSLEYVSAFDGLVLHFPNEKYLSEGGQMHEGIVSTQLGMKGIPSMAEFMMVQRDIELLKYSGGKIHIGPISTKESVALIKNAKAEGLQITSSVAVMNLLFSEDDLLDFDSNLKVMPPLRTMDDKKYLLEGVKDGTIDAIVSGHHPLDPESKNLEFPYASFGASTIQNVYSALKTYSNLSDEIIIEKLVNGPRKILGIPIGKMESGSQENLTIFNQNIQWVFSEDENFSLSKNNPFLGKQLKGKVLAVLTSTGLFE
jgi:dihydroorotase